MRQKPFPLFDKTARTAFRELTDWQKLVDALRDVRLEKNELIQVAAIGSKEDLPEFLRSQHTTAGLQHLNSTEALSLFGYQRKFGRKSQDKVNGQFVMARMPQEHIYLIIFVAELRFWRHGILPLIDSLYPKAARPFLTQSELHQLLRNIQRAIQPQHQSIRVLELSSKKRLSGKARKKFQSVREWTDADFDSAFGEAKEQHVWFRSVSFDLANELDGQMTSTGIWGKLSKYGYFSCNGHFEFFERTVIRQLVDFAKERLKFFSNRDRSSTPDHAPRPVEIRYATDVFKNPIQSRRLVDALHRFKHGTCTVLHANPYVHLSLVDNIDYSSADVWVLSQSQILVVPQVRASEPSLKRIVNHIFEDFMEGEISEFQDNQ